MFLLFIRMKWFKHSESFWAMAIKRSVPCHHQSHLVSLEIKPSLFRIRSLILVCSPHPGSVTERKVRLEVGTCQNWAIFQRSSHPEGSICDRALPRSEKCYAVKASFIALASCWPLALSVLIGSLKLVLPPHWRFHEKGYMKAPCHL